jgi:transcriptional regulator with XRE-family HTH domain
VPFNGSLYGLGAALQRLRKRAGLKQEEVAAVLQQKDGTTVSGWENDGNITAESLEKLLDLYECTLMDLAKEVAHGQRRRGGGGSAADKSLGKDLDAALRRTNVSPGELEDEDEPRHSRSVEFRSVRLLA